MIPSECVYGQEPLFQTSSPEHLYSATSNIVHQASSNHSSKAILAWRMRIINYSEFYTSVPRQVTSPLLVPCQGIVHPDAQLREILTNLIMSSRFALNHASEP